MIGEIHGNAVIVRRIAPADVEPGHSTATRVVPEQTCEDAGWVSTVGMIHSIPMASGAVLLPEAQVASFRRALVARQAYPVGRIMRGTRGVAQPGSGAEQVPLSRTRTRRPRRRRRSAATRVHAERRPRKARN